MYPLLGVPLKINSLSTSKREAVLLPSCLWSFLGSPIQSQGIPPPTAAGWGMLWPATSALFSSPPLPASFRKRRYFEILADFKSVFTGEIFVISSSKQVCQVSHGKCEQTAFSLLEKSGSHFEVYNLNSYPLAATPQFYSAVKKKHHSVTSVYNSVRQSWLMKCHVVFSAIYLFIVFPFQCQQLFFFFFLLLVGCCLRTPYPCELGKNLTWSPGYVKYLGLWNLWTSCLEKKKKKKGSVFFPPVADWQDFLSTCPTARKIPYLSSFAVDNQQEISPQF